MDTFFFVNFFFANTSENQRSLRNHFADHFVHFSLFRTQKRKDGLEQVNDCNCSFCKIGMCASWSVNVLCWTCFDDLKKNSSSLSFLTIFISPTHAHTHRHTHAYTGLFEMIVGVLTTCHKQYASDSSICDFYLIEQRSKFLLHNFQAFVPKCL